MEHSCFVAVLNILIRLQMKLRWKKKEKPFLHWLLNPSSHYGQFLFTWLSTRKVPPRRLPINHSLTWALNSKISIIAIPHLSVVLHNLHAQKAQFICDHLDEKFPELLFLFYNFNSCFSTHSSFTGHLLIFWSLPMPIVDCKFWTLAHWTSKIQFAAANEQKEKITSLVHLNLYHLYSGSHQ